MVDVVRELSRKPKPRYLECMPATFAQPTPRRPQLEGRAKFAAILDGEWDGSVRADICKGGSLHDMASDAVDPDRRTFGGDGGAAIPVRCTGKYYMDAGNYYRPGDHVSA